MASIIEIYCDDGCKLKVAIEESTTAKQLIDDCIIFHRPFQETSTTNTLRDIFFLTATIESNYEEEVHISSSVNISKFIESFSHRRKSISLTLHGFIDKGGDYRAQLQDAMDSITNLFHRSYGRQIYVPNESIDLGTVPAIFNAPISNKSPISPYKTVIPTPQKLNTRASKKIDPGANVFEERIPPSTETKKRTRSESMASDQASVGSRSKATKKLRNESNNSVVATELNDFAVQSNTSSSSISVAELKSRPQLKRTVSRRSKMAATEPDIDRPTPIEDSKDIVEIPTEIIPETPTSSNQTIFKTLRKTHAEPNNDDNNIMKDDTGAPDLLASSNDQNIEAVHQNATEPTIDLENNQDTRAISQVVSVEPIDRSISSSDNDSDSVHVDIVASQQETSQSLNVLTQFSQETLPSKDNPMLTANSSDESSSNSESSSSSSSSESESESESESSESDSESSESSSDDEQPVAPNLKSTLRRSNLTPTANKLEVLSSIREKTASALIKTAPLALKNLLINSKTIERTPIGSTVNQKRSIEHEKTFRIKKSQREQEKSSVEELAPTPTRKIENRRKK